MICDSWWDGFSGNKKNLATLTDFDKGESLGDLCRMAVWRMRRQRGGRPQTRRLWTGRPCGGLVSRVRDGRVRDGREHDGCGCHVRGHRVGDGCGRHGRDDRKQHGRGGRPPDGITGAAPSPQTKSRNGGARLCAGWLRISHTWTLQAG